MSLYEWTRATKVILDMWFDVYKKIVLELNKNIYNMDATGFSIGTMESTRIIVDLMLRAKLQARPGRQECVSIVECICVDGTVLPPLRIFGGRMSFKVVFQTESLMDGSFQQIQIVEQVILMDQSG